MDRVRSIERPTVIPDFGVVCDLVWADPDPDLRGGRCYAVVDGMHAYVYLCVKMHHVCICARAMLSLCMFMWTHTMFALGL